MKILAVDSNPDELTEIELALRKVFPSSTVFAFRDGLSAVKFGYTNRVDAILTARELSRLSGLEVVRMLKPKQAPGLPMVILGSDEKYRQLAKTMHATEYLIKPFTAESLRAALGPRA